MVSMSAQDVRDRLGDRFRLLSGSRRGLERHQTLRHAVQWSYDLLDDDERTVLEPVRCSPAGSTSPPPPRSADDGFDEYRCWTCWTRWSASRWSPSSRSGGHARYGMLETIRQFAEEQLAATGLIGEVRDRHARYFADQAAARWDLWDGPGTAPRWTGSTPSSPTCAPGSVGRPTRPIW